MPTPSTSESRRETAPEGWTEELRGWTHLRLWIRGNEMIIAGRPPSVDDGFPEDIHDCDSMGCGTDHVAARGLVPTIVEGAFMARGSR